jgi:hypothetical protein
MKDGWLYVNWMKKGKYSLKEEPSEVPLNTWRCDDLILLLSPANAKFMFFLS